MILRKLTGSSYEILLHPPYFPDLSLTNYHVFKYLNTFSLLKNIPFQKNRKCIERWFLGTNTLRVLLSKFLRWSLMIFIIKGFRTNVFIFISTTFQLICPPAFFRCLSNSGTFTELRTTSFIESTGVACFDSVSYNRVQVLSIPVLLLACSQDWTSNLKMIVTLEA